ncbi:protein kinase C theta type-like [Phyllobates terribilis]|uniref:protein kinase C theta type-like n=1 Tax=Phyllobates terribilis TaxID=111132 RepID=UPI003CCA6E47
MGAKKRGAIFISSGDKKEKKRRRITSGQKPMDLKQKAEGSSGVRPTGSKSTVSDTIKRRLLFHQVLGRGCYGTVLLAEDSSTRKHFAVKIIGKRALLADGDERVMLERRVLQLASGSPFLVHADFAFQIKECGAAETWTANCKDESWREVVTKDWTRDQKSDPVEQDVDSVRQMVV